MSESKEYLVQPVEKGTVNISEEVVAAIAALAISDVEGVYGLSSSSPPIWRKCWAERIWPRV